MVFRWFHADFSQLIKQNEIPELIYYSNILTIQVIAIATMSSSSYAVNFVKDISFLNKKMTLANYSYQ